MSVSDLTASRKPIPPDREKVALPFILAACASLFSIILVNALMLINNTGVAEIPDFLYLTHYGFTCIYVAVFALEIMIIGFASPDMLLFRELDNGRWYFLSRMGYSVARLGGRRLVMKLLVFFGGYLMGFGVCALYSLIFGMDYFLNGILSLFFFGLVNTATTVITLMAVGTLTQKRGVIVIFSILYHAALAAYLYFNGCYDVSSRGVLAMKIAEQMSLSSVTFLLIAGILTLLMVTLILTSTRDKSAFPTPAPIKDSAFKKLGVGRDTSVVIEGKRSTTVTQGQEVLDRKESYKQQTLMVSLGETNRDKRRPGETAQKTDFRPSAGRVILAIVLILLAVVAFGCSYLTGLVLKSELNMPTELMGYYFVTIGDDISSSPLKTGEIALFKENNSFEAGDIVLFKSGGGMRAGTLAAVHDTVFNFNIDSGVAVVAKDDAIASYVRKISFANSSLPYPTMLAGASILLVGFGVLALSLRKKS